MKARSHSGRGRSSANDYHSAACQQPDLVRQAVLSENAFSDRSESGPRKDAHQTQDNERD
jgi:hypothetical protein